MIREKFITTGYSLLDKIVNNFITPNLILVTPRNKKEFLSDITTFVPISAKIPTAIFSLELKKEDIIHDLVYSSAHIKAEKEQTRNFDTKEWHNLSNAMGLYTEAPIVISDNATSLSDIENLAIKFRSEYNDMNAMIIIDNLQLIDLNEDWTHRDNYKSFKWISKGNSNYNYIANKSFT